MAQLKSGLKLLYSHEAKQKFAALLAAEKPDVVHLNLVHRQITLSVVDAAKAAGVPVVFTQHDLICVCPNYTCLAPDGICEACLKGNFAPCVKKRCVKGSRAKSVLAAAEAVLYRMRGSYNKIDCYITPSGFYRDLLQKAGFTKAPIRHIPNFLPGGTVFAPVPCEAQAKLLYLGRLTPEKGLPTLLKAMAGCPEARLEIAGEGPQRAELEQQAEALGLGGRVKFLGFLTGQPLTERLNACRAVVLPSEWYENGPYSVMEALAAGKPVLGSDIGGIPEMVQEGRTGFLFRPGDAGDLAAAIGRLYGLTEEGYQALCQSAAAFAAETFSEETYLARLLPIYEQLTGKR